MTKERRIIFDLNDIVSIRVKCVKCKGETVLDLTDRKTQYLPAECSSCHVNRHNPMVESSDAALVRLVSGHRIEDEKSVRLLFELNDDGPERALSPR